MKQPLLTKLLAERNVVILGKVGEGKRAIANHIVGENIFRQESATCQYEEYWTNDTFNRILIVDTASLQTDYCNPMPYIRKHFQRINLIIFVIAYGRYTDECQRSLTQVIKGLDSRAKSFSTLVITNCEG